MHLKLRKTEYKKIFFRHNHIVITQTNNSTNRVDELLSGHMNLVSGQVATSEWSLPTTIEKDLFRVIYRNYCWISNT